MQCQNTEQTETNKRPLQDRFRSMYISQRETPMKEFLMWKGQLSAMESVHLFKMS